MIKLMIVGSLGKDCIVKEVNGKNVINFSVASSEKWKDKDGNQKERTTWVECAYWTEKTGVAPYLLKGQRVYTEGAPEADAYMKDGEAKGTLRLRVEKIELLGGNQSNSNGQPATQQAASSTGGYLPSATPDPMDDLPF